MAKALGGRQNLSGGRRSLVSQGKAPLCSRHVPLSLGRRPPCRPPRRLYRHRYILAVSCAMNGFNVLHPMGFGRLRSARRKLRHPDGHPSRSDDDGQRRALPDPDQGPWAFPTIGTAKVSTCLPDYYRWTQWIFLQLFKKGLAYESEMPINWCPSCKTGLANEEVKDGECGPLPH